MSNELAPERLSHLALRLSSASCREPWISSYGACHQWQPSNRPPGTGH